MTYKKCPHCGGTLEYTGSDSKSSFYECSFCGDQTSFLIASDGAAQLAYETTRKDLFERLRRGFEDWRVANWDSLYNDFVNFIAAHDHLQSDLRCQLALVACLTKGFNTMDPNRAVYCKSLIKSVEKLYKQQKKDLKRQMKNASSYDSFGDYESLRAKYEQLQKDYIIGKK